MDPNFEKSSQPYHQSENEPVSFRFTRAKGDRASVRCPISRNPFFYLRRASKLRY